MAAYAGPDILIVDAGSGEVVRRFGVDAMCAENASLVWGPGGDAVVGNSGLERVAAVNLSDGYSARGVWVRAEVTDIEWLNETHTVLVGYGYGVGRAYLIRAEPLTIVDNVTYGWRAWLVGGAVVAAEKNGSVWEWVPGEGLAWETDTGSGAMAADMGEGLLFLLTQDFEVVAVNVSGGTIEWEASLPCDIPESPRPNHFAGVFEAGEDAVALHGVIYGINGSCLVSGIFRDGTNVLYPGIEFFSSFGGWLPGEAALITVGNASAIIYVREGKMRVLDGIYSYVASMPQGAIVTKYVPGTGLKPNYWYTYWLMTPDGAKTQLPSIGCCRIEAVTPTRALIIREEGADLLVIGAFNTLQTLVISIPLLIAGTALAALAYREWRIENRTIPIQKPQSKQT